MTPYKRAKLLVIVAHKAAMCAGVIHYYRSRIWSVKSGVVGAERCYGVYPGGGIKLCHSFKQDENRDPSSAGRQAGGIFRAERSKATSDSTQNV